MHEWLHSWPALALACGLPLGFVGIVEPHEDALGQAAGMPPRRVFGTHLVATGEQPVPIVQTASRHPSTRTMVCARLVVSSFKVLSVACIKGCKARVSCVLPSK